MMGVAEKHWQILDMLPEPGCERVPVVLLDPHIYSTMRVLSSRRIPFN